MSHQNLPQKMAGMIFVLLLLVWGGAPASTHVVPGQPVQPTGQSPQPSLQPGQPFSHPVQPLVQPGLFKFIREVVVAPDANFVTGGFARVNHVPATDRFVVTFGGELAQPSGGCAGSAYSYREYDAEMQATGKSGTFSCDGLDSGSRMIDNTYYFVSMHREEQAVGWRMVKYDAVTWNKLAEIFIPLDYPKEVDNDPMVAYVDGQLDVSSQYNASGTPPEGMTGAATFHYFLTTDLQSLGHKILADTPHICGSSLIYLDDIYYFITADAFLGNVVVIKYDKDWNYLGVKTLRQKAYFSTGWVYDGQRFYVTYHDTSQRATPTSLPIWENIHVAAFDSDWNLVEDVAVTNFSISDNRTTGRPWVILHNNRLYVSYDVDTRDPDPPYSEQHKSKAMVSIYELAPGPAIASVNFNGTNKLVIDGTNFGDNPSVFINKVDRTFRIRSTDSSQIVLKKKLGLEIPGSNLVEVKTPFGTASYTLVL